MTIVRCTKCRIVILDSNEDEEKEVRCPECGTGYKIKLEEGDVVRFERLDMIAGHKEP